MTIPILSLANTQPCSDSDQTRRRSSFLGRPFFPRHPFRITKPISVGTSPFPPLCPHLTYAIEPSDLLDYFPGHSQSPGPHISAGVVPTMEPNPSPSQPHSRLRAVATTGAGS